MARIAPEEAPLPEEPSLDLALRRAKAAVARRPDGTRYPFFRPNYGELGTGIGLFFTWLGSLRVVLFICALVNVFSILANMKGTVYAESGDIFLTTSYGNVADPNDSAAETVLEAPQAVTYLISMVLLVVYVFLLENYMDKKVEKLDRQACTSDDYTVVVSNTPAEVTNPKNWADHFAQYGEVSAVALGVDYGESLEVQEELDELEENKLSLIRKGKPKKAKALDSKIAKLTKRRSYLVAKPQETRRAFITFSYESGAAKCLGKYNPSRLMLPFYKLCGCGRPKKFHGKHLKVTRAPGPTDVIWKNLYLGKMSRLFRNLFGDMVAFLLLVLSFLVLYVLSFIETDGVGAQVIASVAVIAVNQGLVLALNALAHFSKPTSHTGFSTELCGKLILAQFLNTGVLVMLTSVKVPRTSLADRKSWYETTGKTAMGLIIGELLSCVITDAFQANLLKLIDIGTRVKRHVLAKNLHTQAAMDRMCLGPEWEIASKIAGPTKTVLVAMLYAPVMPMVWVIACLAAIFGFFTEKYLLLRHARRPPEYTGALADTPLKMMVWGVVISGSLGLGYWYEDELLWAGGVVLAFGITSLVKFYRGMLKEFFTSGRSSLLGSQGTGGNKWKRELGVYSPPEVEGLVLVWEKEVEVEDGGGSDKGEP